MKNKTMTGLLAAALLTFGSHPAGAQSLTQTFMLVPGIPGESNHIGHENWIEVLSVGQGFSAGQKGNTGACTVSVAKQLDRSGPLLWGAAATGLVFNEIVIEITKPSDGKARPFYVLTLTDAFVSSITSSPTALAEHVTLTGNEATLTYFPQSPDGSIVPKVSSTIKCK